MKVLVGHEQFGHMRAAFRRHGHEAWSCDLKPTRDGSPFHIQADVMTVLRDGWDFAIFHPDCTYLTCSAEWAYGDGPYHQKVKPETLVGAARREAREKAIQHVLALRDAPIERKAIENPKGVLGTRWRRYDQSVQPNQFGHDASKETCWWLVTGDDRLPSDIPHLKPTKIIPPRMVNGQPRWRNQTDSGQNKLTPGEDRAMLRAETYPGLADACADQWGSFIASMLRAAA